MSQSIDPIKLKAAAEHLEWVLQQYPNDHHVQAIYEGLMPLIDKARNGETLDPVDRLPFSYNFADGAYDSYLSPNVTEAFARFATEMKGGPSEIDIEIDAYIRARKMAKNSKATS